MPERPDLEDLIEKAEDATDGPWDVWGEGEGFRVTVMSEDGDVCEAFHGSGAPDDSPRDGENAPYIAAVDPPTLLSLAEYIRHLEEEIQGLDHLVLEHDCPTCEAKAYQHCDGGIGAQGLHLDRVRKALTKTPTRRERTLDCMATDQTVRDPDEGTLENHSCGLEPDHDGEHECGVPGCDHEWEGPEVPENDG